MIFSQSDVQAIEALGDGANTALGKHRPGWVQGAISPSDVRFLSGIVQTIKPKSCVEIGVASGWSSAVFLHSIAQFYVDGPCASEELPIWLTGIDLNPELYTDKSIATGRAVEELVPNLLPHYSLKTGKYSLEVMPEVGEVDFAFIDAHHGHPWATLDLIAVLPFIKPGSWVALHDLNLCKFARHDHRNRAPFYLFYLWSGRRIHSSQTPPMIGAIQIEHEPSSYLDELIEILATPWEVALPLAFVTQWVDYVHAYFGEESAARFANACRIANPQK